VKHRNNWILDDWECKIDEGTAKSIECTFKTSPINHPRIWYDDAASNGEYMTVWQDFAGSNEAFYFPEKRWQKTWIHSDVVVFTNACALILID
jgi:hypothetical protein